MIFIPIGKHSLRTFATVKNNYLTTITNNTKRMKQILSFMLLFFAFSMMAMAENKIKSGEIWPDNNGEHINAHGGGILLHNGTYYWFGEHKAENTSSALVGVTCYSSKDLRNWKNRGVALSVSDEPGSEIEKGCVLERPKVIYNKVTKKFVMWFHLELKGLGYRAARAGVAIADKPEGPYKFLRSGRVNAYKWPLNFTKEDIATAEALNEAQGNYVEELKKLVETLAKVNEQSARLTRDSEEMENLNRTLTGISKVYEMQLKGASQQIGTIDQINEQSRKLAQQIEQLNKIYSRMIEAMTVNMRAAAPGSAAGNAEV